MTANNHNTQQSWKFDCDGPKFALEIGHTKLYGGPKSDMENNYDFDLKIKLYDSLAIPTDKLVHADKMAQAMLPESLTKLEQPPYLHVIWPDFGSPSLPKDWWKEFHAWLASQDRPKGFRVGVYCMGGKGRTGTFLSIMTGLSMQTKMLKRGDPVEYIRKHYCEHAVESVGQLAYINRVTGLKTKQLPSKTYSTVGKYEDAGFGRYGSHAKASDYANGYSPPEYAKAASQLPSWPVGKKILDVDDVEVDQYGILWVNGALYEGSFEDAILDSESQLIAHGLNDGTAVADVEFTPDYEGPNHRQPMRGQ